jgi:Flp pilus assembly protein CpaB
LPVETETGGFIVKNPRRFTLLLSVVLATVVAVGVFFAVSSKNDDAITAAPPPPTATSIPTVAVLVATQDIPAATTLTAAMVRVDHVPVAARNARALDDPSQAIGKMTAVTLSQGEQILDLRLTDAPSATDDNAFAGKVPVGMRAISVVFDEVIGAGALVQPGDHVDVLAYFELSVKDFRLGDNGNASGNGGNGSGGNGSGNGFDYKQYVTTYVVQDVEVLAVSQADAPDQLGTDTQNQPPTPTPNPSATATRADATTTAVARPDAKSVTLAVTPEQAQRLFLASQTVKNESGSLRLSLRAPGDTTTTNVGPAQLGNIPLDGILGDVDQPMTPADLMITNAQFTERIIPSGGLLEFTVTVKNISDHAIKSGKDAAPGFVYTQGLAYDALGYFPDPGTYRLGLNVAGAYPNEYPYRWGLGKDLKPGESVDITGAVRLTEPTPDTRYWFGVIQEPNSVTQDGVDVSDITVVKSETGTVTAASSNLYANPNATSTVVLELQKGDGVQIEKAQGAWLQVRFGQTVGWISAADLTVPPLGGATPAAAVSASPVAGG